MNCFVDLYEDHVCRVSLRMWQILQVKFAEIVILLPVHEIIFELETISFH